MTKNNNIKVSISNHPKGQKVDELAKEALVMGRENGDDRKNVTEYVRSTLL